MTTTQATLSQATLDAQSERLAGELLEMTNALRSAVPAMVFEDDKLLGLPNDSAIVRDWTMVKAANSGDIVLMQSQDEWGDVVYVAYGSDALKAFTWLKTNSIFDADLRFTIHCYPPQLERAIARATQQGIDLKIVYR
jgi:hypothetical protein